MRAVKFALCLALVATASASAEDFSAPVSAVNNQTGAVVVPTVTRQFASGLAPDASGNVTWTFPIAPGLQGGFTNTPSCFAAIKATNTNYVFANPTETAISNTSVTINVQAALKILSISLGALTIWTTPPAGTTINLSCLAVQ